MGKGKEFPLELIVSIALAVHGLLLINYERYVILEMTGSWRLAWNGRMPAEFSQGNSPGENRAIADDRHTMIEAPVERGEQPAAIVDVPPPPLPPPPPMRKLWETLFGEQGGVGDANASTPGDQPMQAPQADEVQAYLGKEAYTRDINSSNPGLRARASDAGGGARGAARAPNAPGPKTASEDNSQSQATAPPPPALLAMTPAVAPSPAASPFGYNPFPAPPPMRPRQPLSLIARKDPNGSLVTTTAPSSTQPSDDGPATAPSQVAERHFSDFPTTRSSAAAPATLPLHAPSDPLLAATLPTTGPFDARYAQKTPATQPFDASLATTHPAALVKAAHYTTQPTTALSPDEVVSAPSTLPAIVHVAVTQPVHISPMAGKPATQPIAEIPQKPLPATLPDQGVADGRVDGRGATTSPIVAIKSDQNTSTPHATQSPAAGQYGGNSNSGGAESTASASSAGGADPGVESESESDAFAHAQYVYVNGRLLIRNGRKVKTVRPRLSDSAYFDLMAMQNPEMEVAATIDEKGKVIDVTIVRSSGSIEVDQPVYRAMWQWEFEPVRDAAGKPRKRDVFIIPFVWR